MTIRCWRLILVACTAAALAGCGSRETQEALNKAKALQDQKQYQDANSVLVAALRAREAKIRPAPADAPTEAAARDALNKKIASDPEILKMERAQILIYLHLERADLASAVYSDILAGHPGDDVVYDALKDKEPLIRTGAVRVLGLSGDKLAVPALTAATKDEDKDVRRAAVAALGTIPSADAVDPLIAALKDSYWFVRSEAAGALGQENDGRAVKPLLDAVADEDKSVESAAENALLLLCQKANVRANDLADRLEDPNPKVATIAAIGLTIKRDARAVPVLLKLTDSPDLTTKLQAIRWLGETGDPSVLPKLRETLKSDDVNMRGWSIIGLGRLRDKDSLPALQAIAADAGQPKTIHDATVAAIARISGASTPTLPNP